MQYLKFFFFVFLIFVIEGYQWKIFNTKNVPIYISIMMTLAIMGGSNYYSLIPRSTANISGACGK